MRQPRGLLRPRFAPTFVVGGGGGPPSPAPKYAWDAADLTPGAVSSWTSDGVAYGMGQGTAARQPVHSATSFSGSPGVAFDGVDDALLDQTGLANPPGTCSALAALRFDAIPANDSRQFFGLPSCAPRVADNAGAKYWHIRAAETGADLSLPAVVGDTYVIAVHRRGDRSALTIEDDHGGLITGTGNTTVLGATFWGIGTANGYAPWCAACTIRWIGEFEPALTPAESAAWITYLGTL